MRIVEMIRERTTSTPGISLFGSSPSPMQMWGFIIVIQGIVLLPARSASFLDSPSSEDDGEEDDRESSAKNF